MQPEPIGLDRIDKPRTQFLNGLSDRLLSLSNRYCQADTSANCHCELFAHLRRVFDLAGMLGITSISNHELAFIQAVEHYRQRTDLRPVCELLQTLQHSAARPELAADVSWPALPRNRHQAATNNYIIHLATPCRFDDYLDRHFTLKRYKVFIHFSPQDIVNKLDLPGKHVIVLNENLCAQHAVDPFDFIALHHRENCSYIVVAQKIDFAKRLQAARHNALLIHQNGTDDGVLTQTIEKCIALTDNAHHKLLLVSNDAAIAECLHVILGNAGMSLDIITTPSDVMLKQLANNDYDLLLIDYFLDGMYGHELTRIIRNDDILAPIPMAYLDTATGVECDEHSELAKADCRIINCYEPQLITDTIRETINHSVNQRRLSRFMAATLRENENYRRTMDAHSIISVADASGRIIDVNQKFCEVSGYSRDELIGQNHRLVNSGTHPRQFFADMWRSISSGKIWHGEICNRRKDGSLYWVSSTIVPFLDDAGKPYQYVSARTEITRIKQIEQRLRISEDRLLRSQSFANIGTWDWNIQDGSLYWSPRIAPLFGHPEGELQTTYDNFLNAVHPDDRQKLINAVNDCVYQGKEYRIEHRCVWPDGTVKWMLERGDVVRDANGKPMHMLGVVMDITELKAAEQENIQQKRLLDMLRIGLSWYVEEHDLNQVADFMLESLLILTESRFGIIGGVHYDEHGQPYMKTHSVSNIAWDKAAQDFYLSNFKSGLEFRNPDNLIGSVMKTRAPVISNQTATDPRRGGLPPGHPPLDSFLGVPVFHGEKLVAMYCLANRNQGYDEAIIEFLKPFNVAYSAVMQSAALNKIQQDTLKELQRSRKEAIDASLAKSQFLSSMSHELRTPLNAILGFSQLLDMNLEKNLTNTQHDNINEILKAGNHLLELINQVLDLAKIEAGKVNLMLEPVSVIPLLVDCIDTIKPLAEKRDIGIIWCLNGTIQQRIGSSMNNYVVPADRLRLKQILLNFLSNAIKYNRDHGAITLCLNELEDNIIRISVKDTGKGIPQEKQQRLFRAFDRLGEEGSETEGTGIGLVISRNIAELMHGKIDFRSKKGEGSEFWIDLPRSTQTDVTTNMHLPDRSQPNRPINAPIETQKIIYIEDNAANMRLVENILKALKGIELITTQDAHLGCDLITTHVPDLVLLDINMPGMNGYDVLENIRQNPAIRHIPVIAISANAMPSDIEKGIAAGFFAYITKPIAVPLLLDTINSCLAGAGASHERNTSQDILH